MKPVDMEDGRYKGDGITTCRWCGNSGRMNTWVDKTIFKDVAYCVCKIGNKMLNIALKKEAQEERKSSGEYNG